MEEEDGLGKFLRRCGEDGVIAIWVEAADDFGTGRTVDAQTGGTHERCR